VDTLRLRRVFLFGNGLSVGCNPDHYSLDALTSAIRDRMKELTTSEGESLLLQVDGIVQALASDEEKRAPLHSFEALAGPIDRLANTLSEIGPLAELLGEAGEEAAVRKLGLRLRGVYRRVVGAVLERVMEHPMSEEAWAGINGMAERLIEIARRQGTLDLFILNYDALLDSALLIADAPGVTLTDEFQGNLTKGLSVTIPGGEQVLLHTLRWREAPYDPGGTLIRRHHLHGAGMWLGSEGRVFKARLEDMRTCETFRAWAEGAETSVEPLVLLGDQKESWAATWPFNEAYAELTAAVARADELILAGYSFNDLPVNRVLRAALDDRKLVTIVNTRDGIERIARKALGPKIPLSLIADPLPAGVLEIG
jgi:hypothetical protein